MSEENVEIVRRIYDEILEHPEAVRDLYAPDYEMDLTDTAPDIGLVRGLDAALEALGPYFEGFDDFRMEIDEVVHADDQKLVVAMHDSGRMHGSDSVVSNHRFHVWTFRDGKVTYFSAHLDRGQALKAAGLSE